MVRPLNGVFRGIQICGAEEEFAEPEIFRQNLTLFSPIKHE
jgi:hypothetical protein